MAEGFSFDDDTSYNSWTFEHVDADGAVNRLIFQADTWTEALQKFIQFLRGSGYFIDYHSTGINADRHPVLPESLIPAFYPPAFYPDDDCNGDCSGAFNGTTCDDLPKINPDMLDNEDKVLENLYAMRDNIQKAIDQHIFDKGE